MMDFIMMTLSFTVAILLASGLTVVMMLNKKVMKGYMKYVTKLSAEIADELAEEMDLN